MTNDNNPMRKFLKEFDLERYFENSEKAFFIAAEFDDKLHFASNMSAEELRYVIKKLEETLSVKAAGVRVN